MPVHPTYPGVYIEEIPSGLHTITGVATSIAAVIGTFERGLLNEALQILSMSDFEREYGGLDRNSEASYAIQQFFVNGGSEAWVVRVGDDGLDGAPHIAIATASGTLQQAGADIVDARAGRRIRGQSAENPGAWGNNIRLEVELNGTAANSTFNLVVSEVDPADQRRVLQSERFINLTLETNTQNNALEVVNQGSRIIQLSNGPTAAPWPIPTPNGTVSGDLGANPPGSWPTVFVVVSVGGTALGRAKLKLPTSGTPPTSYPQYAQALQAAIRNADHDGTAGPTNPVLPAALRPYLTGATVDIIGDGSAGNPRRFVVRAGRGARGYDPAAELIFSGGGLDPAGPVTGAGGAFQPDAPAKMTGTKDLSGLSMTGTTLVINTTAIPIAAGDNAAAVMAHITATVTTVVPTLDGGNHLVLTGADADTVIDLTGSDNTTLTDLGLDPTHLTANPVNLLTQDTSLVGKALTIKIGGAATTTVTFGNGGGQVSTLAELATALGGVAGGTANVDATNGNITITPTTATDGVTIGGTASVDKFGLVSGSTGAIASPQQFTLTPGSGVDGSVVDASGTYMVPERVFQGNALAKTGLFALDDVDLFNILCIPDAPRLGDLSARALYAAAETYVEGRRAMLIVDIPDSVRLIDQMQTWIGDNDSLRHPNAAVYFPRTLIPDPRNQNRDRSIASSGTIAGLWARTDVARGVWKAPAGTDARLRNVDSLAYVMNDAENGTLNPLGINCLRSFPVYSNICWGARTLEGADLLASDWKYVPVRRTTLFLEESLYRGTKWVVFEPNDEPLWAQIRLNVTAFMQDMFRKGAFQGSTPQAAYFVKCDGETTTQQDIDLGIVNIEVGFAPLKPAEFVIIKIQQIVRAQPE